MSKDQKEVCLYCKAWQCKYPDQTFPEASKGQCRRHAPKTHTYHLVTGGSEIKTAWPDAAGGDWCLDFVERRDDHLGTFTPVGDAVFGVMANLRKRMDERK